MRASLAQKRRTASMIVLRLNWMKQAVRQESRGFLDRHPFDQIQPEGAIRRHMVIDQGRERPEILLSHLRKCLVRPAGVESIRYSQRRGRFGANAATTLTALVRPDDWSRTRCCAHIFSGSFSIEIREVASYFCLLHMRVLDIPNGKNTPKQHLKPVASSTSNWCEMA